MDHGRLEKLVKWWIRVGGVVMFLGLYPLIEQARLPHSIETDSLDHRLCPMVVH